MECTWLTLIYVEFKAIRKGWKGRKEEEEAKRKDNEEHQQQAAAVIAPDQVLKPTDTDEATIVPYPGSQRLQPPCNSSAPPSILRSHTRLSLNSLCLTATAASYGHASQGLYKSCKSTLAYC